MEIIRLGHISTRFQPFSPMEMMSIGVAIEEGYKAKAKERQMEGSKKGSGNLPQPNEKTGRVRDKVAKRLGTSGKTYEKAKVVVKAAEEDPDKFDNYLLLIKIFFQRFRHGPAITGGSRQLAPV